MLYHVLIPNPWISDRLKNYNYVQYPENRSETIKHNSFPQLLAELTHILSTAEIPEEQCLKMHINFLPVWFENWTEFTVSTSNPKTCKKTYEYFFYWYSFVNVTNTTKYRAEFLFPSAYFKIFYCCLKVKAESTHTQHKQCSNLVHKRIWKKTDIGTNISKTELWILRQEFIWG